jgi:integrase
MAFNDSFIRGLKPQSRQYEEWNKSGKRGEGRLGVSVGITGQKIFIYRYFWEGKKQQIKIGQFMQGFSLAQAEEAGRKIAAQLQQGINPKADKEEKARAKKQAIREAAQKGSVQDLFEAYTDNMKQDGKRTFAAVLASLEKETRDILPPTTKAKDVTAEHIKLILAEMIKRGALVQSNRVRSYLMAAFNYGLKHDNNPASMGRGVLFGLSDNPVRNIPKQDKAEKVGQGCLTLADLKHLLATFALTPKVGWLTAKLLELIFYTGGQRPYEVLTARWENINWSEKTFLIPSEFSKNKREHLLPLTTSALQVLEHIREHSPASPWVFAQRDIEQHVLTTTLAKALAYYRTANPNYPYVIPRDLRRTCKTLMGELGISKELRDRLQNHALNDVSSKHYDRYDYLPEKRRALEAWEARLNQLESVSNVVSFRGGL